MTEKGRLVEILNDGYVVVEVDRQEACGSCSARSACNPGAGGRTHRATVWSGIPVAIGDLVEIEIADGAMARAVFWAYLVPAALMLAGIFATWFGLSGTGLDSRKDMLAALGGLVGVGIGFILMRLINSRIRKPGTRAHSKFVIRVVRVVESGT